MLIHRRRALLPIATLVAALIDSGAAISVSGISDESNYTGSRSFTVADPAGFVTTATLNGDPAPVGESVGVERSGFYELVVTETPEGGGAPDVESFLFNIREPGRGSTETGLPAFTAVPLVNDAPSAINTGELVTIVPRAYPTDLPLPVIGLLQKTNRDPLWLNAPLRLADRPDHTIQLRRGFGYTLLPPQGSSLSINASTAGLSSSKPVVIEAETTPYTPVGGTIASDVDFGDGARLQFDDDVTVEAGTTLRIGAGSIVRLAPGVDLHVDGRFVVSATAENPTTFAPAVPGSTWGGFFLQDGSSAVDLTGTILHGSGADQDWFDTNPGYASHRDEQALFLVGPAGATLDLTDCYLIENSGQLLHNDEGGDIRITRCLLQGATTCGELTGGSVTVDRSALLLFPDENPDFADGDNDAIYLTTGQHTFTNTVIGYTQDDGIDTGGSPSGYTATSTVQSCWFESILHEAMSNSGEKNANAIDTVFFNCGQTIECGYGGPQSSLLRCLAVANMVGARFGDNYDWDYDANHLTVTDSLLLGNRYHDIWGYDWDSWTYNSDKMTVSGTRMTMAEDLALHPGNSLFDPLTDAGLIAPYMPVPGSEVGVAITGSPSQSTLDLYPQTFSVQLSTFSSNTVHVDYQLAAIEAPDSGETTLHSGTLTFQPSETRKLLDLPLPAGSYSLVRLSLGGADNASNTGGEAWFVGSGAGVDPQLIPRGANWSYSADRAEPSGSWADLAYDDTGWNSGPTPIGYGDGDEATELTAAEIGPGDDRTSAVYFRHEFQVSDPASISALTLNLQRDDGAVVYLNGSEVARSNMDAGAVDYSTMAAGSAGNSTEENTYYEIPLPPSTLPLLQTGSNILAVEIHQSSLTSSDLSFDLDLVATRSDQTFELIQFQSSSYLYWTDPDATLQETGDLIDWTSTDAESPFPIINEDARKFFRLIFR
ncbi:MAG: hypothetical protein ACR2RV_26065 [Verrucomicrobiales bacterium]